ncbi:MAG: flagellar FlbD family protein [Syntrophomonadaceae bacterium]
MIGVTRLNGEKMAINVDLIEHIEETPDTVITLTTGKKFVVKESTKSIFADIIKFRKQYYSNLKP